MPAEAKFDRSKYRHSGRQPIQSNALRLFCFPMVIVDTFMATSHEDNK